MVVDLHDNPVTDVAVVGASLNSGRNFKVKRASLHLPNAGKAAES
jgi:hypothetical protein